MNKKLHSFWLLTKPEVLWGCGVQLIACVGAGINVQKHYRVCTKARRGNPLQCILEAVASYDTWIWHAFSGMPGTLNDINVLNNSPFLVKVVTGDFAVPPSTFHRVERTNVCSLGDGTYPNLSCRLLVKTIPEPVTAMQQYFAQRQEGARKDVERTVALLQRRFWILAQNSRFWFKENMHLLITCGIILHTMILEDER